MATVAAIRTRRRPRSADCADTGIVTAKHDDADELDPQELLTREAERTRAPRQREDGHQVEDDEGGQRHERAHDERLRSDRRMTTSIGILTRRVPSDAANTGVSVIVSRT